MDGTLLENPIYIRSRIKAINNGEEITFEQMIITDNMDREDLIIIDRQVTDEQLRL
ncbi:MAG: hypothetical protein GX425_02060, partial [Peptococcaceae bacterium]|nr:hypothetical protein [Peptococcaceae bacterium]